MKKILLVSDIPPCTNFSAGIYLHRLINLLPEKSVLCFSVLNRHITPIVPADLSWMLEKRVTKPIETYGIGRFGKLRSLAMETYFRSYTLPWLAKKVIEFSNANSIEKIWAPIEGQTMIGLVKKIIESSKIPVYPLVYDPPGWWLREHQVHPIISRQVLHDFAIIMNRAEMVACCSWAMAEHYRHIYSANTIPVVPGLDSELAREPIVATQNRDTFTITLSGQLYASHEWNALLSALRSVKWQIHGKKVKLQYLGAQLSLFANDQPADIEFLGWRSQAETIDILSQSDLLYCPYWFDPAFEEEARFSFPSKLATYLASGRPVFFHGPEYSSPGRFLADNNAAVLCHSLEPGIIIEKLSQVINNPQFYAEVTRCGRLAFDQYLTSEAMRDHFYAYLNLQ